MPTTAPRRPGPPRGRVPQAVTTARVSPEQDRARRMKQYLAAMGVRVVSFPLAVWAWSEGQTFWMIVFGTLATVLPSIAVMLANAVDRRQQDVTTPPSPTVGLRAPEPEPADELSPEARRRVSDPLVGTVVSRREAREDSGTRDGAGAGA